ncbi:MAG: hypothetical protein WA139_01385 [Candidatus Aenigmatarchaeota archaeon]
MANRKRESAESLFGKYESRIVVESIDYDVGKEQVFRIDFAPVTISLIIPTE